jgi:hypothetical protein
MRFDLKEELELTAPLLVSSQLPWLDLGAMRFRVVEDYFDVTYYGDGRIPIGIPAALTGVMMGRETYGNRLGRFLLKLDDEMTDYLLRISFHELGHMVVLAQQGKLHKLREYNYGYPAGLPDSRSGKAQAYMTEIQVFAFQHYMQEQLQCYSVKDIGYKSMLNTMHRWRKIRTPIPKRVVYDRMWESLSHESVNHWLALISSALKNTA